MESQRLGEKKKSQTIGGGSSTDVRLSAVPCWWKTWGEELQQRKGGQFRKRGD